MSRANGETSNQWSNTMSLFNRLLDRMFPPTPSVADAEAYVKLIETAWDAPKAGHTTRPSFRHKVQGVPCICVTTEAGNVWDVWMDWTGSHFVIYGEC